MSVLQRRITRIGWGLALSLPALTATTAQADIFHFRDGRVIFGKLVSEEIAEIDDRQVKLLAIQIEAGAYIQVRESDLERHGHEELSESEREYQVKITQTPPRTAQEHYETAGWCSAQGLKDLAKAHYQRALDLDPNHSAARVAAGYKKDENGRWVKLEVIMGQRRGKVLFRGRWRFPEEVALLQQEEQYEAAIADVKREWSAWNNQVAFVRTLSAEKKQEALGKLLAIHDPRAVPIFSEFLLNHRKLAPVNVRLAYVTILSRFEASAPALAQASIMDPDQRVRNACLDVLRSTGGEQAAVPLYISYLGNANNELVNRAADGLAVFNPDSAVLPLIYALVTTHEVQQGGGSDNYNMNGGLTFGGSAKKVPTDFENASVLQTLTQITGQSYDYDESQWLAWYAATYAAPAQDLRRDL